MATSQKVLSPDLLAASNYRWVMLAVYYLGSIAYGVVFQAIPPLLPFIIPDLRLSYAEAGSLMSLFALPGIALAIPVGLTADRRYGGRSLVVVCYAAMIVGTLAVAASSSYTMMLIGRLIAGMGGVSLVVVVSRLIAHWFTGKELGTAIGIYTTGFPIATILSLTFLGDIGQEWGWSTAVLLSVAVTIIALLTLLALYRPSPLSQAISVQPPSRESIWRKTISIGLPVWLVGLVWFWFNAAVLSFVTFGPDYFSTKGYGLALAGFLGSALMLASPPLQPALGVLLDKYKQPELFAAIGGVVIAVSILLIPVSTWSALPALALLSVGTTLPPPAAHYLASRLPRPADIGLALGILNMCLAASIAIGPFLVGLMRDASGSYELGFVLIAAFAVLCAATAGVLKRVKEPVLEG